VDSFRKLVSALAPDTGHLAVGFRRGEVTDVDTATQTITVAMGGVTDTEALIPGVPVLPSYVPAIGDQGVLLLEIARASYIAFGAATQPSPHHTVAYDELPASDSARAAGVNTALTVTFDAVVGRLYRVQAKGQITCSPTAATYAVELSEGGTTGSNNGTVVDRFQRFDDDDNTITASVWLSGWCLYAPDSTGTKTLHMRNATTSAGSIQFAAAATNKPQMLVDYIGLA
jgi:hypothetical protein